MFCFSLLVYFSLPGGTDALTHTTPSPAARCRVHRPRLLHCPRPLVPPERASRRPHARSLRPPASGPPPTTGFGGRNPPFRRRSPGFLSRTGFAVPHLLSLLSHSFQHPILESRSVRPMRPVCGRGLPFTKHERLSRASLLSCGSRRLWRMDACARRGHVIGPRCGFALLWWRGAGFRERSPWIVPWAQPRPSPRFARLVCMCPPARHCFSWGLAPEFAVVQLREWEGERRNRKSWEDPPAGCGPFRLGSRVALGLPGLGWPCCCPQGGQRWGPQGSAGSGWKPAAGARQRWWEPPGASRSLTFWAPRACGTLTPGGAGLGHGF